MKDAAKGVTRERKKRRKRQMEEKTPYTKITNAENSLHNFSLCKVRNS